MALTGDEYAAEVNRAKAEGREPDFDSPSPTPGNFVAVPPSEVVVSEEVVEPTTAPVAKKK